MTEYLKRSARERFAAANGWKIARHQFSLRVLAAGKMHGGWGGSGFEAVVLDHPEHYKVGRWPVAVRGGPITNDSSACWSGTALMSPFKISYTFERFTRSHRGGFC
jgi:hypothetical protein